MQKASDEPKKNRGRKGGAGRSGDTRDALRREIARLEEELETLREGTADSGEIRDSDEIRDRLKRVTADFANFQKRSRKEQDETRKYAAGPLALDLLGVLDSFRRALDSAEGKLDDAYLEGFRLIADQLLGLLGKHGVTPIEALNQPFDPNFHEALLEEPNSDLPDKTIVEEFETGYMHHDRLLRPTRVKVSRVPSEETPAEDGEDGSEAENDTDNE